MGGNYKPVGRITNLGEGGDGCGGAVCVCVSKVRIKIELFVQSTRNIGVTYL